MRLLREGWLGRTWVSALAVGLLAGCGQELEQRLLGKWHSVQEVPQQDLPKEDTAASRPLLELAFFDDHSCTFRMNARVLFVGRMPTLPCDWIVTGNDLLKLEIRMPDGETLAETYTTRFDGERLELRESNGTSTTFMPASRWKL